ncbi:hypothetical protein [Clostridium malenominatum]|uniref:hypothetical protein n=1 Tax=Clostridium malenominatum TaxID=1539 RepID=UPI0031D07550
MGRKHRDCCEYEYYKKKSCCCNSNRSCNSCGFGNLLGGSCNSSILPLIVLALLCRR